MKNICFPPRLLLLLGVGAAGLAAAHAQHTESSTNTIRTAVAFGAMGVPAAAAHLQVARAKLHAAAELSTAGKHDEAYAVLHGAQLAGKEALNLSLPRRGPSIREASFHRQADSLRHARLNSDGEVAAVREFRDGDRRIGLHA